MQYHVIRYAEMGNRTPNYKNPKEVKENVGEE